VRDRVPSGTLDRIRALEEYAFNAWPARESKTCDGWVFRCADGYTKRANSANAVAPTGAFSEVQTAAAAFFEARRQPVIFRLTPLAQHEADATLEAAGYTPLDPSLVMNLPLDEMNMAGTKGHVSDIRIDPAPSAAWRDGFSAANGVSSTRRLLHDNILESIRPQAGFATFYVSGAPVGYGLAVTENGVTGLFDIVVSIAARGRGVGRALTLALLQWGRNAGANEAYLQVMADNTVARNLYESLGFTEAYRYHYRIKQSPS
jgi:N-acetylglutamate synthase